ncbi:MAG: nucleotidyl transferase AbiEii/AbiGii toxin family protein [Elusimicrobiales bacterium]
MDFSQLFKKIKEVFLAEYNIKDSYNNHFSILFEFTSPKYPRALKIEIRKEIKNIRLEKSIAYSPNSNLQVLVNTVSLKDMMAAKISAFLDRNEIRDVYDMKFMFKKGIKPEIDRNTALLIGNRIAKFTKNDYKVKLGSLLDAEKREYYNKANFQDFKVLFKRTLLTLKVNKG